MKIQKNSEKGKFFGFRKFFPLSQNVIKFILIEPNLFFRSHKLAKEPSEVYFTNFRTTQSENLLQKLARLVKKAGIENIDFQDKFVAIKMHFGEPGNLAFLRPNFAKVIVDIVKAKGGKPFLTDCNTLYVGGRKNAPDHLDAAATNGFNPLSTGCHVIIADGIKGTDEAYVSLEDTPCEFIKSAKIGQAVMDADIFISLSHFKGHESTGFGGAIKNIGMGCGSRAGKMEMHAAGKPHVSAPQCVGCGLCAKNCAHDAISFAPDSIGRKKAGIDHNKCVGCGRCIGACPKDAVHPGADDSNEKLNCKMAEYALAVCKDRPCFHVSVVMDLSPNCDCHSENDAPFAPDVGMFASFDPIALDKACADAVNAMPALAGSVLDEVEKVGNDHFTNIHPTTDWTSQLAHGEKIGLGQQAYKLIRI